MSYNFRNDMKMFNTKLWKLPYDGLRFGPGQKWKSWYKTQNVPIDYCQENAGETYTIFFFILYKHCTIILTKILIVEVVDAAVVYSIPLLLASMTQVIFIHGWYTTVPPAYLHKYLHTMEHTHANQPMSMLK